MQIDFKKNIENIRQRIRRTATDCGRDPSSVQLVAVSKTKPAPLVKKALIAGANVLGENYIQEAQEKFEALINQPAKWHFIGHLQSNKAKYAVRIFDLIHTVDSVKLAIALNKQAARIGKTQQVLIQVNISGETTKSGAAASDVRELINAAIKLPNLRVKGLMTMPPFYDEPQKARPYFKALCELRDELQVAYDGKIKLKDLSMGMTGDFEVAIEEGATLVRIGTALFGSR